MTASPKSGSFPPHLCNQLDRDSLRKRLEEESEPRTTISFYRYTNIEDPVELRHRIYKDWDALRVLGRIYLAKEGINAQLSVPEANFEEFKQAVEKYFPHMVFKIALEEEEISFLKLQIKVKSKILADGQDDGSYDVTNVGKHLTAKEWNEAMDREDSIVVDIRNHYEHEVGHFKEALLPDVDTFRVQLPVVKEMLEGQEDKKVLLYCTGGIRCEKTSAWLKNEGFEDVNQLHGGIIDYVRQVKKEGLENKFIGKNFVFDGRMGERISDEVISHCHVCDSKSDHHTNCAWQGCHTLTIICEDCMEKWKGCCSEECYNMTLLPEEKQMAIRKALPRNPPGVFRKGRRDSRKPTGSGTASPVF